MTSKGTIFVMPTFPLSLLAHVSSGQCGTVGLFGAGATVFVEQPSRVGTNRYMLGVIAQSRLLNSVPEVDDGYKVPIKLVGSLPVFSGTLGSQELTMLYDTGCSAWPLIVTTSLFERMFGDAGVFFGGFLLLAAGVAAMQPQPEMVGRLTGLSC